jgi:hypothetical protein
MGKDRAHRAAVMEEWKGYREFPGRRIDPPREWRGAQTWK